jgi:hypothetical protein
MPKRSKWHASIWKIIVALSVILGLITSILQVFGAVDFGDLLFHPLYDFLTSSIPIYYVVVLALIIAIVYYSTIRLRGYRSCILDLEDGRRIAILCQTPRTTEYLRQKYEEWESRSEVAVIGGFVFDDYMKRLEKQGFLKYRNGKWEVTKEALDYVAKYHGFVERSR